MRNTNKKGFTIVELVVVVAVIAILAAVLIPTFSGIINRANLTADQSAVRNMNNALAAEANIPGDINAVAAILSEAGFNAKDTLVPVTSEHRFYWYSTYNTIVLAKGDKVVFPTNNKDLVNNFAADKNTKCYDLKLGYSKTEVTSSNANDALANGENIVLSENITYTADTVNKYSAAGKEATAGLFVPAGETIAIDLGGKKIETPDSAYGIFVAGNVVISNGTVSSRGIYVVAGGSVTIEENATIDITGTNGGGIKNYGGVVVINNANIKANNSAPIEGKITDENAKAQPALIDNRGGYVVINGGKFETNSMAYAVTNAGGTMEINNLVINATRGAIWAGDGTTIINGGEYNSNSISGHALYFNGSATPGSKLVVNGGTFNNPALTNDIYLVTSTPAEIVISDSVKGAITKK